MGVVCCTHGRETATHAILAWCMGGVCLVHTRCLLSCSFPHFLFSWVEPPNLQAISTLCLGSVRQPHCTHWLVHKKIKENWKKKNRELRKKIRPSLVENTISLKQIRLLHRCFENRKVSVSQDKTIFEWQQQHSAATPANWKLFNSITDTEGRNSSTL